VNTGQVVGNVGSTGHSTGNHLHYEVRKNGKPINPKSFLSIN
jgi:murein DD-endopeptidase MepM/ murein hydrolase activator NlpD